MHYKILGKLIFVAVATCFSFAYSDDYDRFKGCTYSQGTVCTQSNVGEIKLLKDDKSEFKRCPKNSNLCMEKDSRVSLNNSRLFVFDYGTLHILQGGSIEIARNGICQVFGKSFFEIEKNAMATIDNGRLMLSNHGEIRNKGSLYIGNESKLRVASHAQLTIELSDATASSLRIGQSSIADFYEFANIDLEANSELRASGNNTLETSYQSLIHLQYADVVMANGSQFNVHEFSSLKVGSKLCRNRANKSSFIFGEGSTLWLKYKSSINIRGQLILDDRAFLGVYNGGDVAVQGLLQIRDTQPYGTSVTISDGMQIFVGQTSSDKHDICDTDASSLIISNVNVLPKTLVVVMGAHCFTKPSGEFSNEFYKKAHVQLKENSDTNEFKCFSSRNELMEAVKHT